MEDFSFKRSDLELPCVCGHSRVIHLSDISLCNGIIEKHHNGTYYQNCPCDGFKLDNLTLVEQVARARGLV